MKRFSILMLCQLFMSFGFAQDSSKVDANKPDLFFQPAYLFSAKNAASYPDSTNGYTFLMGPGASIWRAVQFNAGYAKEMVEFSLVTARLDNESKHIYEMLIYSLSDTNVNVGYAQRNYYDSTKVLIGSMKFETGTKPARKLDTTLAQLRAPLNPFGTLRLTNKARHEFNGHFGFLIRRLPQQALDDSKTISAFVGLGVRCETPGAKKPAKLVDLYGEVEAGRSQNQFTWVMAVLGLVVLGTVAVMYRKRNGKKS